MDKSPVLKIAGKRYKAQRLKMGAYRQIILLLEDIDGMDRDEMKEDMAECIRLTFGLTPEQAQDIDAADVLPTFRMIATWAQGIFTSKVQQLPNAESPEPTPGE